MAEGLDLRVVAMTRPGSLREHNEDAVAVGPWLCVGSLAAPAELVQRLDQPVLCLVADGMGGHVAGEVASLYVARRLSEAVLGFADETALLAALERINDELYALMDEHPGTRGMGATVAGLLFTPAAAVVFNVGDSRVYREQDGFLRQLTTDDTPGPHPSPGDPLASERRATHLVSQALGGSAEPLRIAPHVTAIRYAEGDRYLACSDGLTDAIDLETMEACLCDDDCTSASRLLDEALDNGAEDDISILLVRLAAAGGPPDAATTEDRSA